MWCSEYLGWVNSVTRVSDTRAPLASRSIVRDDFDTLPSQENCHLAWAKVIAGYSLREATFSSDLLPALSGLARLFSRAARSNYIAGMWESELYRELMWRIQPPYEQPFAVPSSLNSLVDILNSQSPFVAPSWSWVGRKQTITPCSEWEECGLPDFGGGNVSRPRYTLLKATVTPEAEDEFGRITNAVLSLETHAFLLGFDFEKDPEDPMLRWGRSKDSFYNLYIDGRDGPRLRLMLDWLPPEVEWDPSQEKEVMSGLMLALIGSSVVSEAYSDHPSEVERHQKQENLERPFGLVLYCDPRSGRYLRVGVFAVATAALNVAYELPYVKFFEGCELKTFEIV
ncbi:hypothetical protein N8I77_012814 [Diaporthe amygdali]|uniref:Uncharacterized protein n=1 Tax=Phomopsis amygdali TaxID=1214568 RepID=A0AAD9S1P1_PHOAM|nr:hypothetical protein N8I77_012814 [Diaporthe amygdali]